MHSQKKSSLYKRKKKKERDLTTRDDSDIDNSSHSYLQTKAKLRTTVKTTDDISSIQKSDFDGGGFANDSIGGKGGGKQLDGSNDFKRLDTDDESGDAKKPGNHDLTELTSWPLNDLQQLLAKLENRLKENRLKKDKMDKGEEADVKRIIRSIRPLIRMRRAKDKIPPGIARHHKDYAEWLAESEDDRFPADQSPPVTPLPFYASKKNFVQGFKSNKEAIARFKELMDSKDGKVMLVMGEHHQHYDATLSTHVAIAMAGLTLDEQKIVEMVAGIAAGKRKKLTMEDIRVGLEVVTGIRNGEFDPKRDLIDADRKLQEELKELDSQMTNLDPTDQQGKNALQRKIKELQTIVEGTEIAFYEKWANELGLIKKSFNAPSEIKYAVAQVEKIAQEISRLNLPPYTPRDNLNFAGFVEGLKVRDGLNFLETSGRAWYDGFRELKTKNNGKDSGTDLPSMIISRRNFDIVGNLVKVMEDYSDIKGMAAFVGDEHLHWGNDPAYEKTHKDGLSVRQLLGGIDFPQGGEIKFTPDTDGGGNDTRHIIILPAILDSDSASDIKNALSKWQPQQLHVMQQQDAKQDDDELGGLDSDEDESDGGALKGGYGVH